MSAQKPLIVARWVRVGGYGLLVGEWVVTGCVVLSFSGSLSLLNDIAWLAGEYNFGGC